MDFILFVITYIGMYKLIKIANKKWGEENG